MRHAPLAFSASALLILAGCDDKKEAPAPPPAASVAAPAPSAAAGPTASAVPSPSASAKSAAKVAMPERPVPLPQTMVGSGMPIEVQQKAISYMAAMRAPRPDDANSEPDYAKGLVDKLKGINASLDTGPDKAKLNRTEMVANGRQIDLLMSGGCNAATPLRAVVQRAGVALGTLASHGVLVVRCNDAHTQCLQSTREQDDVLCTTAPRHK